LEVGALTALGAAVGRCDAGGVRLAGAVGRTATATSAGDALVGRSESRRLFVARVCPKEHDNPLFLWWGIDFTSTA
jgi:hypothetical protein